MKKTLFAMYYLTKFYFYKTYTIQSSRARSKFDSYS